LTTARGLLTCLIAFRLSWLNSGLWEVTVATTVALLGRILPGYAPGNRMSTKMLMGRQADRYKPGVAHVSSAGNNCGPTTLGPSLPRTVQTNWRTT
jgi:hypothetical protein